MNIVYTGIDFHKRTSTICYLKKDNKKEIITINSDKHVQELLTKENLLVGIEATCGVNHVLEQLKASGKKTDIKDAEALLYSWSKSGFKILSW
jgi:hypothetical protein